jgi:bifunctional DNA-binding transcriptional regulator/antitoxin component of YhaV-PrlF toxin-antitoxin module
VTVTLSPRLKITGAGQVSIPAEIRRRWGSSYLAAEDHGDHLVLRPAPDDPVDAAYGVFAEEARGKPSPAEIREQEREAADEAARAKWPD